jgi:hypothetical protein
MKTPTTVTIYGLVPVPSTLQKQARNEEDNLPICDDANAAFLAWYRHLQTERLATKDEIAHVREVLTQSDTRRVDAPKAQGLDRKRLRRRGLIASERASAPAVQSVAAPLWL